MKKSKSSVPRFEARWPAVEPLDPLARKEGFEGGAGRFEELPGAWRVAIAVGKTNEGESLPAKLQPIWVSQESLEGHGILDTPFLCIRCHCL